MEKISVWDLPESDPELKKYLNFNPADRDNSLLKPETGRNPNQTDRGGWRGYDRVYTKFLSSLKEEELKIMEVGVLTGFGLLAFARYFKNSEIYGIEKEDKYVNNHLKLFKNYPEFERVKIFYNDSRASYTWVQLDEKFDVIIDDGDHNPKSQVQTLRSAWPYLKKGGYYFMEDISYRYTNPDCSVVANEIYGLERQGHMAVSYYHKNEGWENALNTPEKWARYGITRETPKIAVDFIAVIQKLK